LILLNALGLLLLLGPPLGGFVFAYRCEDAVARRLLYWNGAVFVPLNSLGMLGSSFCDGTALKGYYACVDGVAVEYIVGLATALFFVPFLYAFVELPILGIALTLELRERDIGGWWVQRAPLIGGIAMFFLLVWSALF